VKIPRAVIGKFAEVTWRDPGNGRVTSHDRKNRSDVARGMEALATWREYGVIDDVTEGVVRIIHSIGEDPPRVDDKSDDFFCTWVPEALVEQIRVFEPVGEPTREAS